MLFIATAGDGVIVGKAEEVGPTNSIVFNIVVALLEDMVELDDNSSRFVTFLPMVSLVVIVGNGINVGDFRPTNKALTLGAVLKDGNNKAGETVTVGSMLPMLVECTMPCEDGDIDNVETVLLPIVLEKGGLDVVGLTVLPATPTSVPLTLNDKDGDGAKVNVGPTLMGTTLTLTGIGEIVSAL